jgi:large subunit ribosomal protein L24
MNKIRKGDDVVVIAGKDKGKHSTVLLYVDAEHVVVKGVNRAKKHTKPNPVKGVVGGVVEKDMPIHVSNLSLYNPVLKMAGRVGFKVLSDGVKVRIFKSSGEQVGV